MKIEKGQKWVCVDDDKGFFSANHLHEVTKVDETGYINIYDLDSANNPIYSTPKSKFLQLFEPYTETENDQINPKHYNNEHGSLYKIAKQRGWSAYQFDAIKRIDRAEKKGEFESDIQKTIKVLEMWLNEE